MMDDAPLPDDWDEALLAPAAPAPDAALQERLRRQTARLVRRRRWLRYSVRAAVLAVCYLAGLGSASLLSPTPAPPPTVAATVVELVPASSAPAELLEHQAALAPREKQAELFRQASNRYAAQGDWQAAFAASREALDAGAAENADISETDNFVLMALKADRQKKEKRHASSDR
jgi:hypothetical protein